MNLRLMGMGAAGGAALAAVLVWPLAHGMGERVGAQAAKQREDAAGRIITRTLGERDQCRGEVAKVNDAMAAQMAELSRIVSADAAEREAAAKRMEAAARKAAVEAKLAGERAAEAREVIANVADACARAGVPADVVGVLNGILGTAHDGAGDMPAAASGD